VNGVAKDSRRVDLGNGAPIRDGLRADFTRERDLLLERLRPEAPRAIARGTDQTQARWLQ